MGFNAGESFFFYKRHVLGQHGEPFVAYKLRTMRRGADKAFNALLENGMDSFGRPVGSDPRLTRYGPLLRRYFIDETPQLLNILEGHMALVGVRPQSKEEWTRYPLSFKHEALRYKPGLFGVMYAFPQLPSFYAAIDAHWEYLEQKKRDPDTDKEYFERILRNLVRNGRRGY